MSILIKNGNIVTASDTYTADIYIENEKIVTIGKNLSVTADQVIDATNKLVIPGGIDPHVHLDMPFMGTSSSDNYETGTRAALFGGTTMVIDFVLQTQGRDCDYIFHADEKVIDSVMQTKGRSLYHALDAWKGRSNGNCLADYSFHMAVTDFNSTTKAEIKDLIEKEGITSFKTFMAYKGALMIDDKQMIELMNEVKQLGGMVIVHATHGDMIDCLVDKHREEGKLSPLYHYLSQPEITETEASGRFADMSYYTGCPGYIVHMTCEGALNRIRDVAKRNQKVYVETCIQYLVLDASLYDKGFESAKWVMSPPLREKKDQATLWAGINQGTVQVVATDHCPFMWEQKKMGSTDFSKIPNGHPAIEHRMELLFSEGVKKGKISLNKFVEVASTNAAKIFGMYPQKGTIAIDSDADIVIFDPNEKHVISAKTHHMNCDYSAYEGWEVTGKCKTVILRGKVVVDDNKLLVEKGYGKFVKRNKVSGII